MPKRDYSNPRHVIAYDNGEVRQEFSIVFKAEPIGGELRQNAESANVAWTPPERLPELEIHPSMRFRIEHGLADASVPYLG